MTYHCTICTRIEWALVLAYQYAVAAGYASAYIDEAPRGFF